MYVYNIFLWRIYQVCEWENLIYIMCDVYLLKNFLYYNLAAIGWQGWRRKKIYDIIW